MSGLNDRLFAAPPADADKVESRLAQLPPQLRQWIERAGDALAVNDVQGAQRALSDALAAAPRQPDVLRLNALLLGLVGKHQAASANFEAALDVAPDDAVTFWQYARAYEDAGDVARALELRRRAVERLPQSALAWEDLGEHLFTHAGVAAAIVPLQRACELAPTFAPALLKLGSARVASGQTAEGARTIRAALAVDPAFAAAWVALVDIKTIPLDEAELAVMRSLLDAGSPLQHAERTALRFALAAALERRARYEESWRLVLEANAARKRELRPWDGARFRDQEQQTEAAFHRRVAEAPDTELGQEAIFIVGMARSGTTLVEQIIAAHPDVTGAGELAALPNVLTEESARRQQRYPGWVSAATSADWQRLGRRYLELVTTRRGNRARFTDKLPGNWRALGAIRAMLPGARIVVMRRDPLENCWSCFKQYFPSGWEFTYDLDQLGLYWKTFDRAAREWAQRAPERVREQHYEALTEDPEEEIRALLAFCGLPFDAVCLRSHESPRSVQTLSAAQVREPIRSHRSVAVAYGARLNPLRAALGLLPVPERSSNSGDSSGGIRALEPRAERPDSSPIRP